MRQPKLHVTEVRSLQSHREVAFSLDLDGMAGCSLRLEDASKGGLLPLSLDGGSTWVTKVPDASGVVVGITKMRSAAEDGALFCYIRDKDGTDTVCASLVKPRRGTAQSQFNVSCQPQFVAVGDRCIVKIKGPASTPFRLGIGSKKYGGRTDRKGQCQFKLTPSQMFTQEQLGSYSLVRVPVSVSSSDGNWAEAGSDVHFVPSVLRTLAATNDPDRPGCVILDPVANPDQGLRFQSQEAPCSNLAVVGPLYDPNGAKSTLEITHLDSQYVSVGEGYSKTVGTLASACTPLDHIASSPALFDPLSQSFGSIFPTSDDDDRGLNAFSRGAWMAFSLPSADPRLPASDCEVVTAQSTSVSRVYVSKVPSVGKAMPRAVGRGTIKKPPLFLHSIIPTASPAGVAAVVVRIAGGQEVSFSVPWSASALIDLAAQMNDDIVLSAADISAEVVGGRIDVSSDNRFSLLAGQVSGSQGGNAVEVYQFSGASSAFQVTTIKDLPAHGVADSGSVVFLNGPFRGVIFTYVRSGPDTVRLQACPGVNRPGGIVISEDIPCVYAAFLAVDESSSDSVETFSLTMRRNPQGQPVSCVFPSVSHSCRVVCQSQVDGINHLFMYSNCPVAQQDADAGTWMQLTYDGDNRNPRICEDRSGNLHMVWERDVGDGTYVAYATIGPDSGLFSTKALVADCMRSGASVGSPIVVPPKRAASVLNLEGSTGLLELPFSAVNFLRGNIPSGSSYVKREFLGACPAPIRFLITNPQSIATLIKDASGAVVQLAGAQRLQSVETVIFHIDSSQLTSVQAYQGSIAFDGEILAVAGGAEELSSTDGIFSPTGYLFPARGSASAFPILALTISSDRKSLDFNIRLGPTDNVFEMRIVVDASSSGVRLRDGWVKIADSGSAVAMPRADAVCLDYSPLSSKCCAIIPYYTSDSGRQFDGTHKSFGYMIDADVSVEPSTCHDQYVLVGSNIGIDLIVVDAFPSTSVSMRTEFAGAAPFARAAQRARSGAVTLDSDTEAIAGFAVGDRVVAHVVAIPPSSSLIQSSIVFNEPILSVETVRSSVILSHSLISARPLPTPISTVNSLNVSVSQYGRKLGIGGFAQASAWVVMIVFTSSGSASAFLRDGSDDAVADAYSKFLSSFSPLDGGLFQFDDNILASGRSGREFSDFVPMVSSLRLNDLHQNPSGLYQSSGLGFLAAGGESSYNLQCSDIVGTFYEIPTGATVTRPAADGQDGVVYHYILGVSLETVRFFARNTETKTDWCNRVTGAGGVCDNFYEGLSQAVYTGRAKLVAYLVSSESTNDNERTPFAVERIESDHIFDIRSPFRLSASCSVVKDNEHAVRTSRLHLDPLRHEGPESSDQLLDKAHRAIIVAAVEGLVGLAAEWRVDMTDGRRQFDICLGSFLSSSAWFRHNDAGFRNYLCPTRLSIRFSDIDISDVRMSVGSGTLLAPGDLDFTSGFVQQSSLSDLVRNIDFLESTADPSDAWINMAYGASAVDEWATGHSGGIYGGGAFSRSGGFRSIVVQPTSLTEFTLDATMYGGVPGNSSWFWSPRRNRVAHGGIASFRQDSVFLSMPEYASATGLSPVTDDDLLYNIYLRCKKAERTRTDGSVVCPIDMTYPMLYVGSRQRARITKIAQDDFAGLSLQFASPEGDLFVSSFHPLYQKRADSIYVSVADDGDACVYIDSAGKFAIDNTLNPSASEFVVDLFNRDCLAVQTNSAHCTYPDLSAILICLVIRSNGVLEGRVRLVNGSSPDTALQNNVSNAFTSNLSSMGNSWRDISVGSTFAVCILGDGSLSTIGVLPAGWSTPSGNDFVAVACGRSHCVLLREDGTLLAIGDNTYGQCNVPSGCFVSVGAFDLQSCALAADGSVEFWGVSSLSEVGVRAMAMSSTDGILYKACDAEGLLLGTESASVAASTVRTGFQGPYSMFLSIPGRSGRLLKYRTRFSTVSEIDSTVVDTYADPFRSNVVVEHMSVVPSSQAATEYSMLSAEADFGFPILSVSQYGTPFTSGGLSINRIGRNKGLQKSPALCVDRLAKLHCAYEDNSGGSWSVFYAGMRDWDRGLFRSDMLSRNGVISQEPSIACDSVGRVLAAWHERDSQGSVVAATVRSHPDADIPDPCLIDRATSFIREFDADPYDPYLPPRYFSCDILSNIVPAATGTYQFVLSVYDATTGRLLLQTSSAQSPSGWYLNGSTLNSEGQAMTAGAEYAVSYDAVPDDIRSQNVLRWTISAETVANLATVEQVEFVSGKSSMNIEQIEPGLNGYDVPAIQRVLGGSIGSSTGTGIEILLAQENSGIAVQEFPARSPQDYTNLSFGGSSTNVSFPPGVSSLPGIAAGKQYRSFIIHAPAQLQHVGTTYDVDEFVNATITFNAPIVGIVASPSDLGATDGFFGFAGVSWETPGSRAVRFEDGEYIVLSANLRSLDVRFKKKAQLGYSQLRILTSPGESGSVSESGYMLCPFSRRPRCSAPAYFINAASEQKLVHFRATIYTDASRENAIAVYTSRLSPTYWDAGRGSFPVGGVACAPGNSISASFVPRISPAGSVQSAFSDIGTSTGESDGVKVSQIDRFSILPDTTYYLMLESEVDGVFSLLPNGLQEFKCSTLSLRGLTSDSWTGVDGKYSYLSPRRGFARMPSVCASDLGLFYISWQDGRGSSQYSVDDPSSFRTEIKFSTYDSSIDRWSSVDGEGGARPLYDS
jgi:hypothetical protein